MTWFNSISVRHFWRLYIKETHWARRIHLLSNLRSFYLSKLSLHCSIMKECLWLEHLTSLANRSVGTLLSVSAFNYERAPIHIYSNSMPSSISLKIMYKGATSAFEVESDGTQHSGSLVPRPHPDFISQPSRGEKSGEGLGLKLRHNRKWWLLRNVDSVS